jgi:hypothetical protein
MLHVKLCSQAVCVQVGSPGRVVNLPFHQLPKHNFPLKPFLLFANTPDKKAGVFFPCQTL